MTVYIHALREEGDGSGYRLIIDEAISIHALREEGDSWSLMSDAVMLKFLSTPSARRATAGAGKLGVNHEISIHALREEGDLIGGTHSFIRWLFLSTPSARRATTEAQWYKPEEIYFYPRPPRGGRRKACAEVSKYAAISIHALREEGDQQRAHAAGVGATFLSTPSARRATHRWTCPAVWL